MLPQESTVLPEASTDPAAESARRLVSQGIGHSHHAIARVVEGKVGVVPINHADRVVGARPLEIQGEGEGAVRPSLPPCNDWGPAPRNVMFPAGVANELQSGWNESSQVRISFPLLRAEKRFRLALDERRQRARPSRCPEARCRISHRPESRERRDIAMPIWCRWYCALDPACRCASRTECGQQHNR